MSVEYDDYINKHRNSVMAAFLWFKEHWDEVCEILPGKGLVNVKYIIEGHDASKNDFGEYEAYDAFFYGERTDDVRKDFDYAWLWHIHANPHHWQHWVLVEDEGSIKPLEMWDEYILEMLCDWWAFSWKEYVYGEPEVQKLYGIFDWYESHKEKMTLAPDTRQKVERLLGLIHRELDKLAEA